MKKEKNQKIKNPYGLSMKFMLKFAYKNLMQYKQRTILTFLILTFGIMLFVVMDSMLSGFENESIKTMIQLQTGNIKILAKDYDKEEIYRIFPIGSGNSLIPELKKLPYVKGVTERLNFMGILEKDGSSLPLLMHGIDYTDDPNVYTLLDYIDFDPGLGNLDNFRLSAAENRIDPDMYIFIGSGIAKDMGINKGDTVVLALKNIDGMYNSLELIVGGILNTPDISVNSSSSVISYRAAKNATGVDFPTEIALKTSNSAKDKTNAKNIEKTFPGIKANYWGDEGFDIIQITQTKSKFTNIFVLFVLIIAVIGIVNTMIMSIYQKTKEIGTLKAMGVTEREINRLFSFEGTLIGFIGSLVGVLLGSLINIYFVNVGIDITKMMDVSDLGIATSGVIYSMWNLKNIIGSVILGTLISYLATRSSAKRASKLNPAESLRTI